MRPIFTFPFILFLFLTPQFSQASFRVVIDPGHGGVDFGTSRDSLIESQIVLQIAQKIKSQIELNHASEEIQVNLTRPKDQHLSLQDRVTMANQLKADLFISLHANSSSSQRVNGFEFYFSDQNNSKSEHLAEHLNNPTDIVEKIKKDLILFGKQKLSLSFSKETQKQTKAHMGPNQKSVIRRAPFYVIENTMMPSVLVEVGFISNRKEAQKLVTPEYQSEIANLLTQSILAFKEKSDKFISLNER